MPVDLREQLLLRLLTLAGEMSGIVTAVRNRDLLETEKRPAVVLMDGDERTRLTGDKRGRVRVSPSLVTMTPQLWILLQGRQNNANVGQDLNAYRFALIELVAQDLELLQLLGSNGNISYEGCETDLKSGLPSQGSMRLDFAITYMFDPYQL